MQGTITTFALAGLCAILGARETPAPEVSAGARAPDEERPAVDLALCLDTSGSMDGLIEAAKQKLWAIVNDFALARPLPRLRVALLSFGNDGHDPARGWVEILTPLTEDLDLVSQELFALTTNGGTELVGRVVGSATRELDWSAGPAALRILVVAGNESADQDKELPFRTACAQAIARDIVVNAIYCGDPGDAIAPDWREVARLADGHFAAIEHASGALRIASPFDAELARLSTLVNTTYVPFGEAGSAGCSNQAWQDFNAASAGSEAAALRAQAKAQALYVCSWDLVTALAQGSVRLEEVSEEALPEELRPLALDARRALLDSKAAERARIQRSIDGLAALRQAWVEEELRRQAVDPTRSFDHELRLALRRQAEAKGLVFEQAFVPRAGSGFVLRLVASALAPRGACGGSGGAGEQGEAGTWVGLTAGR